MLEMLHVSYWCVVVLGNNTMHWGGVSPLYACIDYVIAGHVVNYCNGLTDMFRVSVMLRALLSRDFTSVIEIRIKGLFKCSDWDFPGVSEHVVGLQAVRPVSHHLSSDSDVCEVAYLWFAEREPDQLQPCMRERFMWVRLVHRMAGVQTQGAPGEEHKVVQQKKLNLVQVELLPNRNATSSISTIFLLFTSWLSWQNMITEAKTFQIGRILFHCMINHSAVL